MPPYGEPDWATPGDTANVTQSSAGLSSPAPIAGVSTQNTDSASDRQNAHCVVLGLSVLNLAIAAMMGGLGVVSLIEYEFSGITDLTYPFLCAYMVIFASLLFLYEFIWWQPVAALNVMFRKNFGFLYGLQGKGWYLIFIAFLTLGLLDDDSPATVAGLDYATGIAWLAAGCLHIFVACTMPHVALVYKPPSAGLANLHKEDGVNGTNGTTQEVNPV